MPPQNPIGTLVTVELLTALDAAFPARQPSVDDTERKIFLRAGQREVIDFLRRKFDERFELSHDE